MRRHNAISSITRLKRSKRGHKICLSVLALLLVLSDSIVSLPLVGQNDEESKFSSLTVASGKHFGMNPLGGSPYTVNIGVDCAQVYGIIPALYVGHYDVDPTRTGIGLNDSVGTSLMKDIDLGFWRVSIGRWEMMDFPSNNDIQKREYFRGSTFEDASNASMYCWEHMDEVFRSVSEFRCIPLICIDYMPRTLANNTVEMPLPRLYTYPNNVRNSPPKNTTVFAEVIKHVVMHYTQGWPGGTGRYYDFEYWEVWNEPELAMFWNGTMDVLFEMYGKISKSIKDIDITVNPLDYKVGGLSFAIPGTQGVAGNITDFLSYCNTSDLPLDFLSWHGYPYNYSNLIKAAQISHSELLKFGFGNSLNILAEWGIPLGIGEQYWNSGYYAAFTSLILAELAKSNLVDYQTHTCMKDRDEVNSSGGYWGILPRELTQPKPVYYVFKAYNMLNETRRALNCTLTMAAESPTSGQATIAGLSNDGTTVTLIYSNFDAQEKVVSANFQNIHWMAGWSLDCTHYLIDNQTDLASVGTFRTGQVEGTTEFSTTFTATPYTIHVIRITLVKPPDLSLLSVLLVVVVITSVSMIVAILLWRMRRR